VGNKKYKKYFRKSYLSSGINGDVLLEDILKYNINKIIEIGVFQGVTARNICELLSASKKDFMYIGIDIFDPKYDNNDEILPIFKSSNPLKKIYHKYISRKEPYSLEGVEKLLKKFKKNVILYKGNSNEILKDFEHKNIDYVIIDGGHSYDTVKQDLKLSAKILSKEGIIMCDDYMHNEAPGVKNAVDDFVSNSDFKIEIINKRMAKLYR
tara:strand:+ start:519 stop:1148 length:630 start_codon:yes stop_codon:yes gene_type:complete